MQAVADVVRGVGAGSRTPGGTSEGMAGYMDEALSEIPGVRVLKPDERHTTRSFIATYLLLIRINLAWSAMSYAARLMLKALIAR